MSMGMDTVPLSATHENLNEQTTQLMQCKPFSEHKYGCWEEWKSSTSTKPRAGANANVRTSEATPLLIAAHNGSAEIINYLLHVGPDTNAADEDHNKPIHVAATRGSLTAVEALLAITPHIQSGQKWSVDGVIEFMQSEY